VLWLINAVKAKQNTLLGRGVDFLSVRPLETCIEFIPLGDPTKFWQDEKISNRKFFHISSDFCHSKWQLDKLMKSFWQSLDNGVYHK